jgi:hypothetical protein
MGITPAEFTLNGRYELLCAAVERVERGERVERRAWLPYRG